MCVKDDAIQCKVRATLNLIHTMSKALATSTLLDGGLAKDTSFYCKDKYLPQAEVKCTSPNRSHLSAVSRQAHRAPFWSTIVLQG